MGLVKWVWSFPALLVVAAIGAHDVIVDQGRYEEGRRHLDNLRSEAQLPRYGPCWTSALEELSQGCQKLTDHEQSFLALKFSNCFLKKAGLKTYPCTRDQEISSCLKEIDSNAFTTYSNFFTHTQSMCYFLKSQVWHEETQSTISKLSETSDEVAKIMEHSSKIQKELVDNQMKSLDYQRQIAANGTLLSKAIETSKQNVKEILEEFKSSTDEQKMMIFEIFDRVSRLQSLLVSEVSWLYTVIFYGTCLLVIYLITATKRTSEARLWLYLILSINFILERFICQWTLELKQDPKVGQEKVDMSVTELPETIYSRIWIIRKLSIAICLGTVSYFAFNFVDYNKVNNQLLEDIRKQNAELKLKMEMAQIGNKNDAFNTINQEKKEDDSLLKKYDSIDSSQTHNWLDSLTPILPAESFTDRDVNEDSDSDSTLSFNSTQTDRTWMAKNQEEELGDLSEESSDEESNLLENSYFSAIGSEKAPPEVQPVNKRTPNSGRKGRKSRGGTPSSMSRHSYNLRTRESTSGLIQNPLLETENEQTFCRVVKKLENISKRNSSKINMAIRRNSRLPE